MCSAKWLATPKIYDAGARCAAVQEIEFLKNATAIRATMQNGEYRLKLLAREVWWHWGTTEDILEGRSGTHRLPGGPKPPLRLASEDEVTFRLEEQL